MPGSAIVFSPPNPAPTNPAVTAGTRVVVTLNEAGHVAYFAGGFARDLLIGRATHDIDIATSARPDDVLRLFPDHSRAYGKSFGVVQVLVDGTSFEVATFRTDQAYLDGRHPEGVVFSTPEDDAHRRDFTINGMFYDPQQHVIIDHVGGREALARRMVQAIGNPEQRFREDHLRIMRAIRFASVLDFTIEPDTWRALRELAPRLTTISVERIRDEFIRTFMEAASPGKSLHLFRDAGILQSVFPELERLSGVEQPPEFHPEGDVFVHTALMLDQMEQRSPELIWSILLHDIAKPETFAIGTDKQGHPRIQFRNHAERGAEMSATILRHFRCSNDVIDAVVTAVRHHMRFSAVPEMRNATLRRWIGAPTFPLELELHRIDCISSHGKLDHYRMIREFQQAIEKEPVLPAPLINGRDLMAEGLTAGPQIGVWLKRIYDAQLEQAFSDRAQALAWFQKQRSSNDKDAPPPAV